ncbi:hypothetical protein SAMN03159444_04291 [Pseudomonas sp. NFACC02]|nr:hypothetical protein SAMN03159444_04291 [Pseudomonas sp. NFACC02]
MLLIHRIRQQAGSHSIRVALKSLDDAVPVGAVRGYEGSERGASVTADDADLPHSPASWLLHYPRRPLIFGTTRTLWETSEVTRAANAVLQSLLMTLTQRIRQQAGSYTIRVALKSLDDAVPVGAVRGYEGLGRTRTNAVCQSLWMVLT